MDESKNDFAYLQSEAADYGADIMADDKDRVGTCVDGYTKHGWFSKSKDKVDKSLRKLLKGIDMYGNFETNSILWCNRFKCFGIIRERCLTNPNKYIVELLTNGERKQIASTDLEVMSFVTKNQKYKP